MIVLDTDLISLLDHPDSRDFGGLLNRLEVANDVGGMVAATIASFEEQMRGWLSYINSRRNVADQVDAYLRLGRALGKVRGHECLAVQYSSRKRVCRLAKI